MAITDTSPDRTVEGIGWMLATTLMFLCVTGIVRHVGSDMPAAEAAFIRYAFGLALILPALPALLRKPPTAMQWRLFTIRRTNSFGPRKPSPAESTANPMRFSVVTPKFVKVIQTKAGRASVSTTLTP